MEKKKDGVKHLEKDLFKTAKAVSKLENATDITSLIGQDKDEKELRDKLVTKLKQKEIQKMKECREKRDTIRDNKFYGSGDDEDDQESMEDISDEELDVIILT